MKTVSTEEVRRWLEEGQEVHLIDVLPHEHFKRAHIPGAINIPAGVADFAERVEHHAGGDKSKKIVVYCANHACDASARAARALEAAGFRAVHDYRAGLLDWQYADGELVAATAE